MSQNQYFIAVDWGSSRLRAFLCKHETNDEIQLVARVNGPGVTKVSDSFEKTLFDCIEPWTMEYGKLHVYLSGQIGSSIGWQETDYLPCPISPDQVASECLHFSARDHNLSIIPGLSCLLPNQHYDLMRGEELQVLGWLDQKPENRQGQHLICLPGTHTKWVFVNNGQIIMFKTAMTGELYDILVNHSILIQDKNALFNQEAFDQGARFTLQSEAGSFVHGLFSVRSKQLFSQISVQQSTSYLSGLLIGSDVRAAINANEWNVDTLDKIALIGSPHLSKSFARVLELEGYKTEICKVTKTTLAGFSSVYRAANASLNTLSAKTS